MSTDAPKPDEADLHPLQRSIVFTVRDPVALRQRFADLEEKIHGPEGRTIDYIDRHGIEAALRDLPPEILREMVRSHGDA